jgi:hypothetical protein
MVRIAAAVVDRRQRFQPHGALDLAESTGIAAPT